MNIVKDAEHANDFDRYKLSPEATAIMQRILGEDVVEAVYCRMKVKSYPLRDLRGKVVVPMTYEDQIEEIEADGRHDNQSIVIKLRNGRWAVSANSEWGGINAFKPEEVA